MTILAQAKSPEGIIQPWANEKLGFSKYLIHAKGDELTLLAEILGLTPSEVNNRLKEVALFVADAQGEQWIISWDKLFLAYPEWAAQVVEPYNNELVLQALQAGRNVIVLTGKQAVRFMGAGLCHDPKTGTEQPTSKFPDVKAFIVITHIPKKEQVKNETIAGEINIKDTTHTLSPALETSILTTKQQHAAKKYLKQMHVAQLALKKLLSL